MTALAMYKLLLSRLESVELLFNIIRIKHRISNEKEWEALLECLIIQMS
jgi:hypothetical protein